MQIVKGAKKWGKSLAFGFQAAAIKDPHGIAVIDDSVGMLCRNHQGFIETALACVKVGANTIMLNTMFAKPQLVEVANRENVGAILYDEEFEGIIDGLGDIPRFVTYGSAKGTTIEEAIAANSQDDVEAPSEESRFTILTSGTTGTPKGARRSSPKGLMSIATLLDRIPLQSGERMMIAAPLFHSWGLGNFQLGLAVGATYVLTRKFDPEGMLRAVSEHRCTSLAAVPIMLARVLALPEDVKRNHDVSSLRITALSGSALPGDLATQWMDEFGDNLHNLYGSTEVATASVVHACGHATGARYSRQAPIGRSTGDPRREP